MLICSLFFIAFAALLKLLCLVTDLVFSSVMQRSKGKSESRACSMSDFSTNIIDNFAPHKYLYETMGARGKWHSTLIKDLCPHVLECFCALSLHLFHDCRKAALWEYQYNQPILCTQQLPEVFISREIFALVDFVIGTSALSFDG